MPVIHHLQQLGHQVIVAGNAVQQDLIRQNFQSLEFCQLEGYNISYKGGNSAGSLANMLLVPAIYKAIKKEREWLLNNLPPLNINGIISDNRYGLYHPGIPSVIMTHQLQVQTGMGRAADSMLKKAHYRMLEKFGEVWVPDASGPVNLAGALSHSRHLPANTKYIGLLSQFEHTPPTTSKEDHLLVLLSGPEPQRTLLEEILLAELSRINDKVVFVAGKQNAQPVKNLHINITYHPTLSGNQLATAISNARLVICRSGYSTLMDLVLLKKKAILIPTPSQTEQEYLARHLQEQGIFPCFGQNNFSVVRALEAAKEFPFKVPELGASYGGHKDVLKGWMELV